MVTSGDAEKLTFAVDILYRVMAFCLHLNMEATRLTMTTHTQKRYCTVHTVLYYIPHPQPPFAVTLIDKA